MHLHNTSLRPSETVGKSAMIDDNPEIDVVVCYSTSSLEGPVHEICLQIS